MIILGAFLTFLTLDRINPLAVLALSMGMSVIIASLLLYYRPLGHRLMGLMILVFSALSTMGVDGLVTGPALGIIGGALAMAHWP